MYNSKYTDNDLKNIIALCEQDEDESRIAKRLADRCRKALAYKDISIRLTKIDTDFLKYLKTYFLKSLHFGNFKICEPKWVTKME